MAVCFALPVASWWTATSAGVPPPPSKVRRTRCPGPLGATMKTSMVSGGTMRPKWMLKPWANTTALQALSWLVSAPVGRLSGDPERPVPDPACTPRQRDPPCLDELDDAVLLDEVLEGPQLVWRAGDLDRERLLGDVDDLRAEDLAQL